LIKNCLELFSEKKFSPEGNFFSSEKKQTNSKCPPQKRKTKPNLMTITQTQKLSLHEKKKTKNKKTF